MTTEVEAQKKNTFLIAMTTLICLSASLMTLTLYTPTREKILDLTGAYDRKVIGKIDGNITQNGPHITVVKIKTRQEISIEIFEKKSEQDSYQLKRKIDLPDIQDAYFNLYGEATNLALTDVDSDGVQEIIAPTLDQDLSPRLNVIKYDPTTGSFDRAAR